MNIKLELLKNEIAELVINRLDDLDIDADSIIETTAASVLAEIQGCIKNEKLSDFEVVEEIVSIFEKHNISSGSRHDF